MFLSGNALFLFSYADISRDAETQTLTSDAINQAVKNTALHRAYTQLIVHNGLTGHATHHAKLQSCRACIVRHLIQPRAG